MPPDKGSASQPTETTICKPTWQGSGPKQQTDDGEEEKILVFATDEMLDKIRRLRRFSWTELSEFMVSALFHPLPCR